MHWFMYLSNLCFKNLLISGYLIKFQKMLQSNITNLKKNPIINIQFDMSSYLYHQKIDICRYLNCVIDIKRGSKVFAEKLSNRKTIENNRRNRNDSTDSFWS